MTRYGMREADFAELAALLAEILKGDASGADGRWREAVTALRGRFTKMHYCL
jgi:glycine/serine hydroxymethyltransferase